MTVFPRLAVCKLFILALFGWMFIAAAHAQEAPIPFRKNLGTNINSQWDDIIPIISADGKTLYFDRKNYPLNVGGTNDYDDIWYSEALNDTTWTPAKDLAALNTKNPNAIFSILPDNNTA